MKKLLLLITLIGCAIFAKAQSQKTGADSGSFYLHKFAQNIGKETYYVSRNAGKVTYSVDFKFVDRGQAVPLKTTLTTTPASEPLGLAIKGNVARSAHIDDSISIS